MSVWGEYVRTIGSMRDVRWWVYVCMLRNKHLLRR